MGYKSWISGSDYEMNGTATLPSIPFSMFCHIKFPAAPSGNAIIMIAYDTSGSKYSQLAATSAGKLAAHSWGGGSVFSALTASAISGSVYYFVAATFAGPDATTCNDRKIWTDSTSAQDTTSVSVSNAASKYFGLGGNAGSNTLGGLPSGSPIVAFAGIANVALTSQQVADLKTYTASSVLGSALTHYWALDATPPTDSAGSWNLSLLGSNSTVDNADVPTLTAKPSGGGDTLYGGSSRGILDGVMRGTVATDEYVQRRRSRIFVPRHYGER